MVNSKVRKMNDINRRKSARTKVDLDIYYTIFSDPRIIKTKEAWVKCESYDISLNGVGLRLNQILLEGDFLKIKLMGESEDYIYDAVIENINGQRLGISFISPKKYQLTFIEKLLRKR